jgi:hypothetical protein
MTIFDILHIPIIEYPVTFHNNRFYAYKNILVDLHNEIPITLTELTPDNKLFKQLNLTPNDINTYINIINNYKQTYIPNLNNQKITYFETTDFVSALNIYIPNLNNLKITYFETTDDDDHYHITHSENNITTHHYTHKGLILGNL